MHPTIEQIKRSIPLFIDGEELQITDEKIIEEKKLKESFRVIMGNWIVKFFRSAELKKVVLVVLIAFSGLEGIYISIPPPEITVTLRQEIANYSQWNLNVEKNDKIELQNKYYSIKFDTSPSPEEKAETEAAYTTLYAPITGSNQVESTQNLEYQPWNPYSTIG